MSIKVPVLGHSIKIDEVSARDGDGLKLYEDGGAGIFVKDGGFCGLGLTAPLALLHLYGVNAHLRVQDDEDADSYFEIDDSGMETASFEKKSNIGPSVISISPRPLDGTNNAMAKFFRATNTTGTKKLLCYKGNGSSTIEGQIGVDGGNSYFQMGGGNFGIGTSAPGNPLAVNRSADGIIVDFESADIVEGNVSIAANTTSYNAFMGSHYTQLKEGQEVPLVGAIVIATGEIIPCEANIKVPVIERYYDEDVEVPLKNAIEDNIVEVQVDTGQKGSSYALSAGEITEIQIPIFRTETINKGKKLIKGCELDKKTGKIYKTVPHILAPNEIPPLNVQVLEQPKEIGGEQETEIKIKEVGGISKKEYFSYIELASQKADRRVYGVYHTKMSDDAKGQSFGEDDKPIHQIAAVGLYKVRVTDTNGDITAGDYIQSSIRPGEGERQDDDVLHNYTVAKSVIDVKWNEVAEDLAEGYKWKLIPATLHAG